MIVPGNKPPRPETTVDQDLALISDGDEAEQNRVLDKYGSASNFAKVVEDGNLTKPDSTGAALGKWLSSPEDTPVPLLSPAEPAPDGTEIGGLAEWLNTPDEAPAAVQDAILSGSNPDENVRVNEMAKKAGMPSEAVRAAPQETQQVIDMEEATEALQGAHYTSDFLSDPGNVQSVAIPEIPQLVMVESYADRLGRLKSGMHGFMQSVASVFLDVPRDFITLGVAANNNIRDKFDAVDGGMDMRKTPNSIPVMKYYFANAEERKIMRASLDEQVSDPREDETFQALTEAEDAIKATIPTNPAFSHEFTAQLASGGGSFFAFFVGGAAGKVIKIPLATTALMGAASGSQGQFRDALQHGASIEDAMRSSDLGRWVGASEAVPISRVLDRFNKTTGGSLQKLLIEGVKGGLEEGFQELFATVMNNLIASDVVKYDEKRGMLVGTGDAAGVGFTLGAFASVVAGMVGMRRGRAGQPNDRRKEFIAHEKERVKQMMDAQKELVDAVMKTELVQREPTMAAGFVSGALENAGIDYTSMPIDAFAVMAEMEGVTVDELASRIGVEEQVAEAVETGVDIEFTMPQYAEHVLLGVNFNEIAGDIRFHEDGVTENEVKEEADFKKEEAEREAEHKEGDEVDEVALDLLLENATPQQREEILDGLDPMGSDMRDQEREDNLEQALDPDDTLELTEEVVEDGPIVEPPVTEDGTVEFTHFSPIGDITDVDPEFHGSNHGIRGGERQRRMLSGYVPRIYVGLGVGQDGGYTQEAGTGENHYNGEVKREQLYDWDADPEGWRTLAAEDHPGDLEMELNIAEGLVRDAGYKGYWTNAPQGMVAALFEKTEVSRDPNSGTLELTEEVKEPNIFTMTTEDQGDIDVQVLKRDGEVTLLTGLGVTTYSAEFVEGKTTEELIAYAYEPLGVTSVEGVLDLTEEVDEGILELNEVYEEEALLLTQIVPPKTIKDNVTLAEQELGLEGMFQSGLEAGMTRKVYAKYRKILASAKALAEIRTQRAALKRIGKRLTKEYQAEHDSLTKENEGRAWLETVAEPIYDELWGLSGSARFNRADVVKLLNGDTKALKELPRINGRVIYEDGGDIDPNVYAAAYGNFQAGDIMLFAMMDAQPLKVAVARKANDIMNETHGDLVQDIKEIGDALQAMQSDPMMDALIMELEALDIAKKEGRLKPKLVRAKAREEMGAKQLKDIKPTKYLHAAKREGRAAVKLLKQGDLVGSAAAKARQIKAMAASQEAHGAQARIRAQREYMTKFIGKKKFGKLPVEYLETIQGMLEGIGMGARVTDKKVAALEAFVASKLEEGIVVPMPRALAEAAKRNHQDMTLDEWNELHTTIKALQHTGVSETVLAHQADNKAVAEVVGGIVDVIEENHEELTKTYGSSSWKEKRRIFGRKFVTMISSLDTVTRLLDGGEVNGPAHTALKRPIDLAMTEGYLDGQMGFIRRSKQEAQELLDLYHIFNKQERGKMHIPLEIPGVEQPITREAYLAALLNMGNEYNHDILLDVTVDAEGNARTRPQFTQEELQAIVEYSDAKDMAYVNGVWEYLESFREEIGESLLRRKNERATWVEATPFEGPHGTFTGGYFPVRFDRDKTVNKTQDNESIVELTAKLRNGKFSSSHTRASHKEARKGAGGRPVLLSQFTINAHVNEVIYDLEVGDALNDVYKVMHHTGFKEAMTNQGLIAEYDNMDIWLEDAALGDLKQGDVAEQTLRFVRQGFTISKLAYKPSVGAVQLTGFANTVAGIGPSFALKGVTDLLAGTPTGEKSIFAMVAGETGFMEARQSNYMAEVSEAQRALSTSFLERWTPGESLKFGRQHAFVMITKMQYVVDVATWLGARAKAESLGYGEAGARAYADQMVKDTQGSGIETDRTTLERGTSSQNIRKTEWIKMHTTLISYFMRKLNLALTITRREGKKEGYAKIGAAATLAGSLGMMYFVEALVANTMLGRLPDFEDEEEDNVLTYATKEAMKTFMNGIPIVREISSTASGYAAGGSLGSYMSDVGGLAIQLDQTELDAALAKSLIDVLGPLMHLPTSEVKLLFGAATLNQDPTEDAVTLPEWVLGINHARRQ